MSHLAHDAVVVRRTGGLELHLRGFAEPVEPVQNLLVLLRRDNLVGKSRSASHGHEQENVPGLGAKALTELENPFEARQIALRDRCVDLEGHPCLGEVAHAAQGGVEGAFDAPEAVMTFCVGPIDGDGDTVDTCVVDFLCSFRGNQCAVG